MPLSFQLSEDTDRLRHDIREWAVAEVRPIAREIDRTHQLGDSALKAMATCPIDVSPMAGTYEGLAALGGGAKDHYVDPDGEGSNVLGCVLEEELNFGDSWPGSLLRGAGIGDKVVRLMGTPAQVDRWVGGIQRGEFRKTAFALTEPHFGSDPSQVATTAVRDGDVWVINGTKMYCSGGATADWVVVFATIDKGLGRQGVRAFIVERDTPGFSVAKANEDKMGLRFSDTAVLVFDDAQVPLDHCLGETDQEANGFIGALETLSNSRPVVAASALGLGRAAHDVGGRWLREHRTAFAPRRWSRIDDELARLECAFDEARRLVLRAAWTRDCGRDHRAEASAAKAYAAPLAEFACARVLQLMGPDGYSEEHLVEKWHRDLKIYDIFEGSGQIQRITISRRLFGRDATKG